MKALRITLAEAGASVADLGTIVPVAAALVLRNHIDPIAAFAVAGALFIAAGVYYRVPLPVQPIKAAAAIAIATGASPRVIAAAGIVLGGILLALAVTRTVALVVKLFPRPVIRGLQLGVGILLLLASVNLVREAPGSDAHALAVAAVMVALLAASEGRRIPVGLALVAGGIAWTLAHGGVAPVPHPGLPHVALPSARDLLTALTLLVIPQLPLTLGNAIVGTADLEREYFGARASRATPTALSVTCGVANLGAGVLGGMPLCHGSGGLTAYYRLGARTAGVNLVAGGLFLTAGLLYGRGAVALFQLIPATVLGALLAYVGVRHALLVADQRGRALAIALASGALGGATRNLAYGMALGLALHVALGRRARG